MTSQEENVTNASSPQLTPPSQMALSSQMQTEPGPVPYPRFQEVVAERNKLRTELEHLDTAHKESEGVLGKAKQDLAAAQRLAMQLRIAYAAGLPLDLANRLSGEDESALKEDAQRLLQYMRPLSPGVPVPPAGGAPTRLDLSTMSPEEIRKRKGELLRQV